MPKSANALRVYTIGHSNRPLADFLALLDAHGIRQVADVRTVPKSRHNPQFNAENLRRALEKRGVGYARIEALGGFRHAKKDSKNLGWRNLSFRGYADYMATPGFSGGLEELERIARKRPTAVMCAEAVPWRCHRSLIADALAKRKWSVLDIMTPASAPKHRLTPFLKVRCGVLTYPGARGRARSASLVRLR
ncbi:MAG TPA: DUF488 domain-containing protein [Candidatus Paceibacterota bacterium]|nr:DUF488 domain-containing protein [Candidatus Paceibacterota bacterium]